MQSNDSLEKMEVPENLPEASDEAKGDTKAKCEAK